MSSWAKLAYISAALAGGVRGRSTHRYSVEEGGEKPPLLLLPSDVEVGDELESEAVVESDGELELDMAVEGHEVVRAVG